MPQDALTPHQSTTRGVGLRNEELRRDRRRFTDGVHNRKPAPGEIVPGSHLVAANHQWREQYNPLRQLTISRAVLLKEMMVRGEFCQPQWTFFHMERDYPTLCALIERRISAIVELDCSFRTAEPDKFPKGFDQTLAEEQAAALRELYYGIDNLSEAIEALAMASFRGFALLEKQDLNGDGLIDHLGITDTWNWIRDGMYGDWIWNPECNLSAQSAPRDHIIPEEWFLIRTVPRPLDLIALPLFCKAALGEKDWSAFIEIFGIPGGVVTGPPNVPVDREAAYAEAGKAIAQGGVGYLPNGSAYTPNDPPHAGAPFESFLEYQKKELILAGTGGQLTMLAESGSGTLAGGAHQETFQKIARAEGMRISSAIFQRQLDKPYLQQRFPGQPILAYFELDVRQSPTTKEVISDVKELSAAGYLVDADEVSERTGYDVTTSAGSSVPSDPTSPSSPNAPPDPAPIDPNVQQDPQSPDNPMVNRSKQANPVDPVDLVARSVAQDLLPVRQKLAALLAIENPSAQRIELLKFLEDAPVQAHEILARPSAAEAIADSLSTAVANALVKSKLPKK
jgi:hypothetical protein